MSVSIKYASKEYESYAQAICDLIESAAKKRGTGIAKRDPEYIKSKMNSGNAVIALDEKGNLAGFCYIETWEEKKYVANSGLIVDPKFRGQGWLRKSKQRRFNYRKRSFRKLSFLVSQLVFL